MTMDKFTTVLAALTEATENGKVMWQSTPADEVFRAWVGGGTVKIGRYSEDGRDYYRAVLYNSGEQLVDEIEGHEGPGYDLLESLFMVARRKARGGDDLLNSILKELQRKEAKAQGARG